MSTRARPDHPYLHALLRDIRRGQGPTDAFNVLAEYPRRDLEPSILRAELQLVQAVAEEAAARGILQIRPNGDFELLIPDYVCR